MSLTIRQRAGFELLLFTLARAKDALTVVLVAVDQAMAFAEHVRHGGDPAEQRRDRWVTRDAVKRQYRSKSGD